MEWGDVPFEIRLGLIAYARAAGAPDARLAHAAAEALVSEADPGDRIDARALRRLDELCAVWGRR